MTSNHSLCIVHAQGRSSAKSGFTVVVVVLAVDVDAVVVVEAVVVNALAGESVFVEAAVLGCKDLFVDVLVSSGVRLQNFSVELFVRF